MKILHLQFALVGETAIVATFILFTSIPATPQTPFYHGKTVTIIQGRDPSGTGDMRVRAMRPFLENHIPGNPTVVSEFMASGGSRKAVNYKKLVGPGPMPSR